MGHVNSGTMREPRAVGSAANYNTVNGTGTGTNNVTKGRAPMANNNSGRSRTSHSQGPAGSKGNREGTMGQPPAAGQHRGQLDHTRDTDAGNITTTKQPFPPSSQNPKYRQHERTTPSLASNAAGSAPGAGVYEFGTSTSARFGQPVGRHAMFGQPEKRTRGREGSWEAADPIWPGLQTPMGRHDHGQVKPRQSNGGETSVYESPRARDPGPAAVPRKRQAMDLSAIDPKELAYWSNVIGSIQAMRNANPIDSEESRLIPAEHVYERRNASTYTYPMIPTPVQPTKYDVDVGNPELDHEPEDNLRRKYPDARRKTGSTTTPTQFDSMYNIAPAPAEAAVRRPGNSNGSLDQRRAARRTTVAPHGQMAIGSKNVSDDHDFPSGFRPPMALPTERAPVAKTPRRGEQRQLSSSAGLSDVEEDNDEARKHRSRAQDPSHMHTDNRMITPNPDPLQPVRDGTNFNTRRSDREKDGRARDAGDHEPRPRSPDVHEELIPVPPQGSASGSNSTKNRRKSMPASTGNKPKGISSNDEQKKAHKSTPAAASHESRSMDVGSSLKPRPVPENTHRTATVPYPFDAKARERADEYNDYATGADTFLIPKRTMTTFVPICFYDDHQHTGETGVVYSSNDNDFSCCPEKPSLSIGKVMEVKIKMFQSFTRGWGPVAVPISYTQGNEGMLIGYLMDRDDTIRGLLSSTHQMIGHLVWDKLLRFGTTSIAHGRIKFSTTTCPGHGTDAGSASETGHNRHLKPADTVRLPEDQKTGGGRYNRDR
ncbi:hypothetical protein BJ508DRAFT_418411 [Ascobolus immersus RN42]|uniref:Uncharacterized protein n=1 Tax=Ascobolus immersus RN42 TaxID=1160509 RepID=A0A3N4HM42_ASCIM|nr:hypothetical protein BJ508DRAFT_418411 [Ascobolus immersus RN42]